MNIQFTQSNIENILKKLKITEKEVIISDPASIIKKEPKLRKNGNKENKST